MGKLNIQGDLDIHNYLTATNTNLYLSAVADYSIRFRIGTTEVARITPSGCLNINTTQNGTDHKLYVNGSGYFVSKIFANGTGARLTTSNDTQSIWFGINTDGTAWGVYNITTSKYIVKQTEASTNFYGNADTATKLATARTISLTGSVTGSGSFDGSGNLSITTTTNHTHDDTKVQQSRSTSTNWRSILTHYTAKAQGTDPSAATNVCYYTEKASIKPSTGQIYAAGGLILGNTIKWTSALTNVTAPTVVAAYIDNDSANGLGFAYTSNLSVGYATNAGGISSLSPVLAAAGESNTLQAINNYDYYTNDTPIKHSLLGIIKALDFQWFTSHWRIGNLRSGSTASSGFGFAFSADNSTWNLRAYVGVDGYLWANKLGSYNYGATLPSSGHKGEIFFKV